MNLIASKTKKYLINITGLRKIPHALLFIGPEGSGKFEAAVDLIRLVEFGREGDSQRVKKLIKSGSPDIIIIEAEKESLTDSEIRKEIKIDQIEKAIATLKFFPYQLKNRFIIINEAELMNETSANALLKSLEEPSPNNYFILLSSSHDLVRDTISSRCVIIRFFPLGSKEFFSKMDKINCKSDASVMEQIYFWTMGRQRLSLEMAKNPDLIKAKEENRNLLKSLLVLPDYKRLSTAKELSQNRRKLVETLLDWEMLSANNIRKQLLLLDSESKNNNFVLKMVKIAKLIRAALNKLIKSNAKQQVIAEELFMNLHW